MGTAAGGHLRLGCLQGPMLRDCPLHTHRGCGRHPTSEPLQKLLIGLPASTCAPTCTPSSSQQMGLVKPQSPTSLRGNAKFFRQPPNPACSNPSLILSHSLPHSLGSSHVGPLDIYRYQQSYWALPSACSAPPPGGHVAHSLLPITAAHLALLREACPDRSKRTPLPILAFLGE